MIDRRDALKLALGSAAALAAPAYWRRRKAAHARSCSSAPRAVRASASAPSNPANLRDGERHAVRDRLRHGRQPPAGQRRRADLESVKYIFISHHHSDHNLEYGNLFYNAWAAGLSTPIHSFGPKGIEAMTKTYWELNKFDVETRIEDEGRPDPRKLLIAKDITEDGVVLQTPDVKVTAFRTPHPPITDNFAYKFETPDGTIVFSSDTAYNPKLAEFAKGADVLVHEAIYLPCGRSPGDQDQERRDAEETSAREPHRRPRTSAASPPPPASRCWCISHLVPGDDLDVTDDDWTGEAKKHFSGRIIVAKDLMQLALPVVSSTHPRSTLSAGGSIDRSTPASPISLAGATAALLRDRRRRARPARHP